MNPPSETACDQDFGYSSLGQRTAFNMAGESSFPTRQLRSDQAGGRSQQSLLFTPLSPPAHPFSSGGLSEAIVAVLLQQAAMMSVNYAHRISELLSLKKGWDGGNAEPVRRDALFQALGILVVLHSCFNDFRHPFVAPTYEGYIFLDWASETRTLEMELTEEGWIAVGTLIHPNGERDYFETANIGTPDKMIDFYRWFEGDFIWPE